MSNFKPSIFKLYLGLFVGLGFSPLVNAYVSFTSLGIGMATDINDAGQVVGYSGTYVNPIATLWDGSTPTSLSTPNGSWSIASGINNSGQIAGSIGSGNGASGISQATLWNGSTTTVLGSVGGQYAAQDINNDGQVVGYSFYPVDSSEQAILWAGTTPSSFGAQSFASGINNTGQVVGFSNGQATLWNGFSPTLLANPSNAYASQASGINDVGQIVGGSSYYNIGYQATLWNGVTPTELAGLGGIHSSAYGINNIGQIVGYSDTIDGVSHATLWTIDNGIMASTDLNNLINPALGFTLTSAQAINNASQIVGYGINSFGQTEAFILSLTTVPIPGGSFLMLSGLSLIGFVSKRRKLQPQAVGCAGNRRRIYRE